MSLSIGELVGYLDLDTTGVDKGVAKTNGLLGKVSWGTLVVGAGAAAAGVGAALFGIGGVFDDVSDSIRVGTGATGKHLENLTEVAKQVGDEIPASFSEIGPVLADVHSRMGATGDDLKLLSEQFLEAGRLSGEVIDVQAVTGAFNAFNLGPKQASAAMDQLWSISQQTGTSMSQLGADVARQAPLLQQFGFTLGQSASLLGNLDAAGIDGNRTMATLSRAMVTFAKDGKEPQKALQDTIGGISDLLAKGDEAGAVNLAGKVFGTRGAAQFVAAVKSGKVNVDSLFKATAKGGDTIMGASKDTADFAEQWQLFKNDVLLAVEPVATRVFGAISKGMATFVSKGAPAIGAWVQGVARGEGVVGGLVTTLGTLAGAVADTVGWFNKHRTTAAVLAGVIAGLVVVTQLHAAVMAVSAAGGMAKWLTQTKLISAATKTWAAVQWAMNAAMSANPIMLAVIAIAALVAGVVLAYRKVGWFRAGVDAAFNGVKAAASAVAGFVTETIPKAFMWVVNKAKQWGPYLLAALVPVIGIPLLIAKHWDKIKATAAAAFRAVLSVVKSVGNGIKAAASAVWNGIKAAASAVWRAIVGYVRGQVNLLLAAVKGLASFPGKVAGYFGEAKSAITKKMGEAVQWLRGIPGRVTSAVGDLGGVLKDAGRALVQGLLDGIEELWDKVTDKLDSLKDKAHSVATLGGILGKKAAGSVLFAPLMESIQSSENPVRDALKNMAQFIGDSFDKQLTAAGKAVDAKYDQIAAKLRKKLKGKALEKALARNEKARDKAAKKAMQSANAAEAALMATTSVIRQQLAQNIADQAANQQALEVAKDQLEAATELRDSFRDAVSGSARDYVFTFDGGKTAQDYVDQVKKKLADLIKFRENMAKLSGVLDAATYQDMIDKGVEGAGDMAEALANDPAAAAALADLSRQVNEAADGLGADASTHLYQAGVDSAQQLYNGLASKQEQLVALATTLGQQMAAAIEEALAKVGAGGGGKGGGKGKGGKGGKGGGKGGHHRTSDVPGLATGGRVSRPTLAYIGEGREAETVLPDSVLRGLLTKVHEAGKAEGRGEQSGRNAPLIGQVVQQQGESADSLAERLWFKTRTRG